MRPLSLRYITSKGPEPIDPNSVDISAKLAGLVLKPGDIYLHIHFNAKTHPQAETSSWMWREGLHGGLEWYNVTGQPDGPNYACPFANNYFVGWNGKGQPIWILGKDVHSKEQTLRREDASWYDGGESSTSLA